VRVIMQYHCYAALIQYSLDVFHYCT
jgi:hypothetical protein